MVSLALLEQDVAAIYVDTSNYVNQENISLVLKNHMNQTDAQKKEETT